MRKVLVALAILPVMAVGLFFASPWISELILELRCKQPSENCLVRMRAMGNVWSLKGYIDRATHWYVRAAAEGDVPSMFHLGWLHEQAAIADFRTALSTFAAAQRDGRDVELVSGPNAARAIEWYRQAADKGYAPAMNNLGQLYLSGMPGVAKPEEGIRWLVASARAGNPVARMNLMWAHASGQGVDVNPTMAQAWATWRPEHASARDLDEPVFARTLFVGEPFPVEERVGYRAALEAGRPVTASLTPIRRDPSLPTFKSVQRRLDQER